MASVLDNALRRQIDKRRRHNISGVPDRDDCKGRKCGRMQPHRIESCSPVHIVHDGRIRASGGSR